MSGLDDSLSDVAPRKKYPFELEKAIHNVMFIQHHMQRQDEFNAVSIGDKLSNFNKYFNDYMTAIISILLIFASFAFYICPLAALFITCALKHSRIRMFILILNDKSSTSYCSLITLERNGTCSVINFRLT